MQSKARHPALGQLAALIGEWEIEMTHQAMPGVVIRGRSSFSWLGEGVSIVWRASYDYPDIPDSFAVIGYDDRGDLRHPEGGCTLHYFDVRGVTRLYRLAAEPGVWRYWRDAPGFAQRFTGTFSADGEKIDAVVELCRDGVTWEQDALYTYRRVG